MRLERALLAALEGAKATAPRFRRVILAVALMFLAGGAIVALIRPSVSGPVPPPPAERAESEAPSVVQERERQTEIERLAEEPLRFSEAQREQAIAHIGDGARPEQEQQAVEESPKQVRETVRGM